MHSPVVVVRINRVRKEALCSRNIVERESVGTYAPGSSGGCYIARRGLQVVLPDVQHPIEALRDVEAERALRSSSRWSVATLLW
ncbi:MAG: hypothetical protein R2815_09325 [Flavobacteriales bacterium]